MSQQLPAIIVVLPLVMCFFIFFSGWWMKKAGYYLAITVLAGCVLLSLGIMKAVITVPETNMGDIMGDLNTRRARVQGMDTEKGRSIVTAHVPLAEMQRYTTDLRSMTGGRGVFTMEFSPRTRDIDYLTVLPEWGSVVLTTGWIEIGSGDRLLHSSNILSDLELFWDFYQTEILTQVYDHIKKSTGNQPDFSNSLISNGWKSK